MSTTLKTTFSATLATVIKAFSNVGMEQVFNIEHSEYVLGTIYQLKIKNTIKHATYKFQFFLKLQFPWKQKFEK